VAILPWATTIMGASIMYFAGRARTRQLAWWLGVANQLLWGFYSVTTRQWGFLGGCLLYGSAYIRNLLRGD
jgi:hypothetical protein